MDGNFDKTQWGARVDYPDLRDQYYSPALAALREEHLPPCDIFDDGTCLLRTGIRNQNSDPTCVGHALAALIELQRRTQRPDLTEKVSANMLYQMSRYHASQGVVSLGGVRGLRSAIKAFYNHGVALSAPVNLGGWPDEAKFDEQSWPDTLQAAAAEDRALGAYYRLRPILSHYTAAIAETGAVLASARIHSGWLPDHLVDGCIRAGTDGEDDLGIHAFVLLGYTREGFLVLNSWGERWGGYRLPLPGRESPAPGIGLWAYADWARSIGDGWVLRLGVAGPSAFPVSVGEWGVPDDVLDPKRSGFGSVPYRELRGSFLNLEDGRAVDCGAFATPSGAVEATIEGIVARVPDSAGVVIHLPGVLATQHEAFATAVQQRRHAERKGLIYLTCFWCADFAEEIVGIIDDIFRRCAAQVGDSADVDDAFEVAARNAGRAFWRDIERHAQAAALPCGPGSDTWNDRHACEIDPARGRLGDAVERIDAACRDAGKPLHLTVDGAGVLVLDALLDRIAGNDLENRPDAWLASLRSVGLALPAIPVERAEGRLLPFLEAFREKRPGSARIFVPDDRTESRIGMHGYSRSILHLVRCSFLDGRPPMLGMAEATKMPRFAEIRESLVREFKIEGANRIQQTDLSRSSNLARLFGELIQETKGDTGVRSTPTTQQEEARPIMTDKISLDDLQRRMADGKLTQDEMERYLIIDAEGSIPFAPALSINPETVEVPLEDGRSALALNALNEIERFRRKSEFYRRIASGDAVPRIAAEGDSWFQFPLLLEDVIDVVGRTFPVYDTSAAGDLLENMAARREYIKSLRESGARILLLSAGGNDLCAGGALARHLEAYDPNLKPADYLKRSYQAVLDNAIAWYERICRDVQANFPNVTIITHGYDYVIPDGGRWLGKPMEERGITDPALQRKIVVEMVDQLNRALRRMTQSLSRVAYVDCRGSVPSTGWFDELHPRNPGFSQVADRITHAIREIAGGRGIAPEGRTRADPAAAPALVRAEGEFRALHVGLNRIDPYHYAGWDGALRGCENDARAMRELAEASGFQTEILLNEDATREALTDGMRQAASGLKAGDFFLLTYSGHGGQIPDWNGDEEEIAGKRQPDSTLCLYDSQMIDDELFDLWTRFETGVRILFLPDSCHSGSVVRAVAPQPGVLQATDIADLRAARMSRPVELLPRCMPSAKAAEVVAQNEGFYRERSRAFDHVNERLVMSPVKTPMRASLISISACQDEETAFDGDDHGMFTAALLKTWERGNFFGNYREFHRRISLEIGVSSQNPRLLELPPADPSFSRQRPFGGRVGAEADRTQTTTDAPLRTETGRSLDALLNGEGDEHDLPVPGARGPSGSRGAADQEAVSRFSSFIAGAISLKHFSPEEFLFLGNSHHGSGKARGLNGYPPEELWPNIVKTAEVLDELRAKIGAPIRILSAYRNGAYNKAIGGENHSMHMQFRACDIAADGVPASKVAEAVLQLRAANGFKGGVGRYPGFTHVDTRGVNADWVQNGRKAGPPPSPVRESADPHADLIREYAGPTFAQRGRKRGGRGTLSDESGLVDLATAQGAVNGAGIISFDPAMSEATRKAVLYSTQFAQRAADARADAIQDRLTWWTVYGSALKAVGWVTQGSQFRRMATDAQNISIDTLALDAISASLVGPGQLVSITAILDSLRKAADGDRRIELLDLYSSAGGGGLFQLGAAQAEGPGVVTMALGAVQFQKLDQRKKILFVRWGTEESEFWVAAERMTLNLDFYAGHAQETVEAKLADAADLIQTFEIKEPAH